MLTVSWLATIATVMKTDCVEVDVHKGLSKHFKLPWKSEVVLKVADLAAAPL